MIEFAITGAVVALFLFAAFMILPRQFNAQRSWKELAEQYEKSAKSWESVAMRYEEAAKSWESVAKSPCCEFRRHAVEISEERRKARMVQKGSAQ